MSAGEITAGVGARVEYPQGSRWRVVKPGARIVGMVPDGPGCFAGFRLDLAVGTILTSRGESMSFGDGVPILKWADADGGRICNDAMFEPDLGWGRPDPTYLERVPA